LRTTKESKQKQTKTKKRRNTEDISDTKREITKYYFKIKFKKSHLVLLLLQLLSTSRARLLLPPLLLIQPRHILVLRGHLVLQLADLVLL